MFDQNTTTGSPAASSETPAPVAMYQQTANQKKTPKMAPRNKVETQQVPLIAHIILTLDTGGLENGLVNLINHMPDRYRHVIVCLSHFTEFRDRIRRPGVEVVALNKKPGKDFGLYARLWRLLRRLRPDIVHTRDFATLDAVPIVALSGVRHRVHSLHGWHMKETRKYLLLHWSVKYLIHYNVTVSQDLAAFLEDKIRISGNRTQAICNGVDTQLFHPRTESKRGLMDEAGPEFGPDKFIIGTAGRLVAVKDQLTLIKAFAELVRRSSAFADRLRLVLIGDGPLKDELRKTLEQEDVAAKCWLAGNRADVAALLRELDVFVLPSISEGISNTILEAMATGLPVIATNVGGSPELVVDGETGRLVPVSNTHALAGALESYAAAPEQAVTAGQAGRKRAETKFSMRAMAHAYTQVYDQLLRS